MINPYKLNPTAPRIAVLVNANEAVDEYGETFDPWRVPPGIGVWCSHDLASELLASGKGECLAWNGTRIRWRPQANDDDKWPVSVMQLPFPESVDEQLDGLCTWRNWLASYGATCAASLGSAAWSLMRASLVEPLWTSVGMLPPIKFTLGGRIEVGHMGPGEFGGCTHWDFRAAYAHTIGTLEYGGRWYSTDQKVNKAAAMAHLKRGGVGFIRCKVEIPRDVPFGPLPERPRKHQSSLAALIPIDYPRGCTIQGTWTWQEVEAALSAGCKLLRVHEVFIHLSPEENRYPFLPWWDRVQEGRKMRGFAGLLAKATGNALWGQFSLSPGGKRQVMSYAYRNGQPVRRVRLVERKGQRPNAPDLSETITGRVRAQAFRFMCKAGEDLLTVHTDGGWVQGFSELMIPGLRRKEEAYRIQVLTPQVLRYWPEGRDDSVAVVSGWPPQLAVNTFEKMWEEEKCTF